MKVISLGRFSGFPQKSPSLEHCKLFQSFGTISRRNANLRNLTHRALQTPIPDCLDDDDALTVLLEQWFNIFNAAFFGGELSGGTLRLKVSRGIVSDDPIFNTRPNRLAGIYWPHTAIVEVNLNTDFSGLGFVGSIEHMHIVTLLHEMLHVSTSPFLIDLRLRNIFSSRSCSKSALHHSLQAVLTPGS